MAGRKSCFLWPFLGTVDYTLKTLRWNLKISPWKRRLTSTQTTKFWVPAVNFQKGTGKLRVLKDKTTRLVPHIAVCATGPHIGLKAEMLNCLIQLQNRNFDVTPRSYLEVSGYPSIEKSQNQRAKRVQRFQVWYDQTIVQGPGIPKMIAIGRHQKKNDRKPPKKKVFFTGMSMVLDVTGILIWIYNPLKR